MQQLQSYFLKNLNISNYIELHNNNYIQRVVISVYTYTMAGKLHVHNCKKVAVIVRYNALSYINVFQMTMAVTIESFYFTI